MPNRATNIHKMTLNIEQQSGVKCIGVDKSIWSEEIHYYMSNGDVYVNRDDQWIMVVKGRTVWEFIRDGFNYIISKFR